LVKILPQTEVLRKDLEVVNTKCHRHSPFR
jgi:hypothetical protein